MRSKLTFEGVTTRGRGLFSKQIKLPGRSQIIPIPPKWPEIVHRGTFNIRITNIPDGFESLGEGNGTGRFDSGNFAPAFKFPAELIEGNTLSPTNESPLRGLGQAWEAHLHLPSGKTHECWMFRRFGSQMAKYIELVSSLGIRDTYSIPPHIELEVLLDIFEGP